MGIFPFPPLDIVVRLRQAKRRGATCAEAADEIERLRAALKDAIDWIDPDSCPSRPFTAREMAHQLRLRVNDDEPRPPGSIIDPKNVPASAAWAAEMRATDEQSEVGK